MIHRADTQTINQAAEIIKSGGMAVFPTETVYGLGADATNPDAVARIFEIKNMPIIPTMKTNSVSPIIPWFLIKLSNTRF